MYITEQPPPHTVTGPTCGAVNGPSVAAPLSHTVAAFTTRGCSLYHIRLQPLPHRVAILARSAEDGLVGILWRDEPVAHVAGQAGDRLLHAVAEVGD